jgi:HEAT repeats
MDPYSPQPSAFEPENRGTARKLILLILVFFLLGLCTIRPNAVRAAFNHMESLMGRRAEAAPPAPAPTTADLEARLAPMTAQGQAELLLSEAVNHRPGALDLLAARTGAWRGVLQQTPRLTQVLNSAWNSSDLQVRGASLEIQLDLNDIRKDSASVSALDQRVAEDPAARPWALMMLATLGNRGVEPLGVLHEELHYVNNPSDETRGWAVEALATLGTNEAIDPLLDALQNDPSPAVRERAACGLAEAGMFTREQRRVAVPRLLDLADDPALDPVTRNWVFHALQDITRAGIGADARAWRNWWAQHGQ